MSLNLQEGYRVMTEQEMFLEWYISNFKLLIRSIKSDMKIDTITGYDFNHHYPFAGSLGIYSIDDLNNNYEYFCKKANKWRTFSILDTLLKRFDKNNDKYSYMSFPVLFWTFHRYGCELLVMKNTTGSPFIDTIDSIRYDIEDKEYYFIGSLGEYDFQYLIEYCKWSTDGGKTWVYFIWKDE